MVTIYDNTLNRLVCFIITEILNFERDITFLVIIRLHITE